MPIVPVNQYYYRALWQRISSAKRLMVDVPSLSIYLSGVASECMLRAWFPENTPFQGRHHMPSLLEQATILDGVSARGRQKVTATVKALTLLWNNSMRYYPDDRMVSELRNIPKYKKMTIGKKGPASLLRRAAREAFGHAFVVIKAGERP